METAIKPSSTALFELPQSHLSAPSGTQVMDVRCTVTCWSRSASQDSMSNTQLLRLWRLPFGLLSDRIRLPVKEDEGVGYSSRLFLLWPTPSCTTAT
jgi:hypothetical protein